MTDARPRRSDALRTREQLLDAAAVVLARDVDPTLIDIATEAGVSRATIYRHFSDIAAIRAALLEEVQDLAKVLLQQHLAGEAEGTASFSDRIVEMVRTALPIQTRYSSAMANEPVADAGMVAMFQPVIQAMVRQAQERSEVRHDLDPAVMAEAMITLGFYTARRIYRDGVELDVAVQVFATFMRGMETSPRTG